MIVPERLHQYALSLLPELRKKFAAKGIKMNNKKFYDQPFQHGLEFLGSHIRPNRIHLNAKTINRCKAKIMEMNRCKDKEKELDVIRQDINKNIAL